MNYWTELSAEFAQQKNYLDELYKVYPITPNLRRTISNEKEEKILTAYKSRNNLSLIKELLQLDLFPIKDSYIAFLKRDTSAMERNPQTINRIAGNLYQMGFDEVIAKCTEPKETNRQIGPMFKQWINNGVLGTIIYKDFKSFLCSKENCVLNMSDMEMKKFATEYLGYNREKGLDFIAKFNKKYIIAEAKFITDFGGHQNAQFDDAVKTQQSTFKNKKVENPVIPIAIMDGVLYIKGNNKMYRYLTEHENQTIVSALLLREFLYSL